MQIIKENTSVIRNTLGTTLTNPATTEVIYTPPEGEGVIRNKLKELEDFIHAEDDIDPLIRLALIHYQFEAIHPFTDGNGRTGRIVLLLYLKLSGLMELPSLFMSEYINNHKQNYYTGLRLVTEKGDWENWILYILDMIEQTALKGRQQISRIEKLMTEMGTSIQTQVSPKIYSKDLMEVLFKLPYTKRASLIEAGIGNLKTVGLYLNELEKAGFLKSEYVGKEKLYLNAGLMKILTS
jgi:Fic family protein